MIRQLIVLLASAAVRVAAQQPPAPFLAPLREAVLAHITLSNSEAKAVSSLATAATNRRAALGPEMMAASPEARVAKLQELSKEHAEAIRKVLTPKQRIIFDSNYKAWTKERADHPLAPPQTRKPPAQDDRTLVISRE